MVKVQSNLNYLNGNCDFFRHSNEVRLHLYIQISERMFSKRECKNVRILERFEIQKFE